MKKIKDFHIFILIAVLMVFRLLASGKWFGCIVWGGLLVSLFDLINKLYKRNIKIVAKHQKVRYGFCFIVLNILAILVSVTIMLNIIFEVSWLNDHTVLDEITLLTLLLTLSQDLMLNVLNRIICKELL